MDNLSEKAAQVVVKYIDLDNSLAELANSGDLSGALGQPLDIARISRFLS